GRPALAGRPLSATGWRHRRTHYGSDVAVAGGVPCRIRRAECVACRSLTTDVRLASSTLPRSAAFDVPSEHPASTPRTRQAPISQAPTRVPRRLIAPTSRRRIVAERFLILIRNLDSRFVDIDSCRLRRGVSENGLHGRFAHPPPHELGRETVPERVWRNDALDANLVADLRHDVLDGPRADLLAGSPDLVPTAEGRVHTRATRLVTACPPVCRQSVRGAAVEMDRATLATLSAVDVRGAGVKGHVGSLQRRELRSPHGRP